MASFLFFCLLTLGLVFLPGLGDLFVDQILWVSFSRTDSDLCIYDLVVWSNSNLLHNSQGIIFPTQSCLVSYSFCARMLQSLTMWLNVLSVSLHNLLLEFMLSYDWFLWCYFVLLLEEIQFLSRDFHFIAMYNYYNYCSFESFFLHLRELMVFHWSLSDSKSPQFSRTLLSILADLNNAVVWMVSTCPLFLSPPVPLSIL